MTSDQFRAALRSLGISQRAFADRTGISKNTISRWALGQLKVPRYAEYILELLNERHDIATKLASD